MVFNDVLLGEKVPVPELDHCPPVAIVTEPPRATVALFAQTLMSLPAFAVGPGVMLIVICEVIGKHVPLLPEVTVSTTVPVEISEALGTYVPVKAFGKNTPEPLVVHVPIPVVQVPVKATVGLLEQTV